MQEASRLGRDARYMRLGEMLPPLLGAGAYGAGLRLMEQTRADIGDDVEHLDPAALSVLGSLHLRSALLASRAGDADLSDEHLRAAARVAEVLGDRAGNQYGMEFGAPNIAVHEVAAAVECGWAGGDDLLRGPVCGGEGATPAAPFRRHLRTRGSQGRG